MVPVLVVGVQVVPEAVLVVDDQHSYEKFQKMKPIEFQLCKGKEAHEFLLYAKIKSQLDNKKKQL